MRYLIIICLGLIACNEPVKTNFIEKSEIKDSLSDLRFIRQMQFDREIISDVVQDIDKDSLIGTWVDSIILLYEDNKWNGWKPIDKINKITLFKSSKYKWEEINTYSNLDTIKYGQYWTSNFNDSSYLQLIFNMESDTLFNQGDEGFANSFLIDYFNSDTLLIRAYNSINHSTTNEAHLMIRKN